MSKENIRTLAFAAVAGVSVLLAVVVNFASQPKTVAGFERLGEQFFPDFTDPSTAAALKLVSYNEESATVTEFNVEFKDGLWRLPTYNNYPADAEDRLAQTATSVIGISRGALAGRRETDQERFGVIDPLDETKTTLKGRGQRLTLTKADGTVLADYIIGKPVEGAEGQYYVRRPDENETYRAALKINLSTKFTDWIEADLLKLDRDALKEIVVHKYSIDETQGAIVNEETSRLTRDKSFDPWKLDGIDDTTEEVNEADVRTMVSTLDDLKIAGVRPKPPGLKPDLTLDREYIKNPLQVDVLRSDLAERGFYVVKAQDSDEAMMVSNEGEMSAATDGGVVYSLHFGKVFAGSPFEVETGFTTDAKKDGANPPAEGDKKPAGGETPAQAKDPEAENKDAATPDKKLEQSRYLFIAAHFDPKYLGDSPVEPVKPEAPAAATPAAPEGEKAEGEKPAAETPEGEKPAETPSADKPAADAPAGETPAEPKPETSDDGSGEDGTENEADEPSTPEQPAATEPATSTESAPPAGETPPATTPPVNAENPAAAGEQPATSPEQPTAPEDPQKVYEAALQKYDTDLAKYKTDKKAYDDKLAAGKKLVDDLNRRFGQWYYVISDENFKKLRLSRAALVKPKEAKPEGAEAPGAAPGGLPNLGLPNQ